MKRVLWVVYLVALHIVLSLALVKTDLISRVALKLNQYGVLHLPPAADHEYILLQRRVHLPMDPSVPKGSTIFLGDSITWGLATVAVEPLSVNYGINGQRSDQLLKSMDIYESMKRAGRVVVTIGTNDLLQAQIAGIDSRYRSIISKIPSNVPIVMSSVPPMSESARKERKIQDGSVEKVVAAAKVACESDSRCVFVDAYGALSDKGRPLPEVLLDDGIHLGPKGYEIWITAIRSKIASQSER